MSSAIAKKTESVAVSSQVAGSATHAVEISQLKATIAALEKRIARDAEVMARKQAGLEMSAMAVRKTLSFQLGNLLINGFKSPRAFVKLPGALMTLRAEAHKRRAERRDRTGEPVTAIAPLAAPKDAVVTDNFDTLLEHFNDGGIAAVAAFLAENDIKPHARASAFTQLARHLQSIFPEKAAEAAREAYECDPQPYRAKWLAFRLFEAGCIAEPAELLAALPGTAAELSVSEQRRAEEIAALSRLRTVPPALLETPQPAYEAIPGALLYVAASALPYHTSGYTVRTHELVRAMAGAGLDVTVLTRPGYPWDRPDSKGEPEEQQTVVDGVLYLHRKTPSQALPLDVYFDEAASAIAKVAKAKRVEAIHAASNHVNALPALIAARSLGIPFVYEMRGLWELSRASKVLNYESSERFQIGVDLEAYVAKNADRVYVISKVLGNFIQGWGVDPARVAILPNCINADTIKKAEDTQAGKITDVFTIGYAGAMVGYEGLDVLIDAIAELAARGRRVHARLIGDGDMRAALEALSVERGMSDQITFLGKLPPDQARAELAATSAVAIPRKPHHVCEIIPPIKLVEAMALGMPVIVPDLPVFLEEVRNEETGILFKAGNASALASAIERFVTEPELAAKLGANARQHAAKARVWGTFAKQIKAHLDGSRITEIYEAGGCQAVIDHVQASFGVRAKAGAQELLRAGSLLAAKGHSAAEYPLAQAALKLDRSDATLRGAFAAANRADDFALAVELIEEVERIYGSTPTAAQLQVLAKMKAIPAYLLSVVRAARPLLPPQIESIPNRFCYVLHNTLPYSSGGYATRSHGVASGMRDAGWDVVVLSRPGFPVDTKPELMDAGVPPVDVVEGIPYVRTLAPSRSKLKGNSYIFAAADALEAQFREYRPSVVMAASNNVTAIPALLAARRLGLPFIYEIRGFWEITRLSRETEYGDTPQYRMQSMLEAATAEAADHAFTLTEPMREELVERGVSRAHIDLLPNSCDPTRFEPAMRDEALAEKLGIPPGVPVIGYIGTFVEYEGLEYMAEACALLKQQGMEFRLLMVGNENTSDQSRGPITEQIIQVAEQHGFTDWLILTGRIPHDQVEAHYSLIDIAPFPRKALPVCEMVSPMKPLEALAMEKAVIVSSVRALVEMIQDGKTGLVFEKGNVASLADTLKRLIESPQLREQLGIEGRKWVERERTWVQIGEKAGGIMTRLSDKRTANAA